MNGTAYIAPASLLQTSPPQAEWHAHGIPADTTLSFVVVIWEMNPNAQPAFEALPGVLALGEKWETLPAQAVPLLASLVPAPAKDAPAAPVSLTPDTVATVLRKIPWPGARLVR